MSQGSSELMEIVPVIESLLLYHPIVVGIIITEIMMTSWQECGFRVTKPW